MLGGGSVASHSIESVRLDRCGKVGNIDFGLLVFSVEIERETDLHERTGVGSDLYAQLIEGAI